MLLSVKKPRTIAEELIRPSATGMASTVIDEATASKLKAIPLSDNTAARCIYDTSKDTEEQVNEKTRHNSFALQTDEATDSNEDLLLTAYVRLNDREDLREDLLFCKRVTARATADKLFQIT